MDDTLKNLRFISEHNAQTGKYMHGKDLDHLYTVCIGMLERITFCSNALIMLINNLENNESLEFSIGIILRSSLLDGLTVVNLLNVYNEQGKAAKSETERYEAISVYCDRILSDGLKQTASYILDGKKMGQFQTDDEMHKVLRKFIEENQNFFEEYKDDGKVPKLKLKDPDAPFKLNDNLNETDLSNLRGLYDSYSLYSKYDHFGILYFGTIARPFNKKKSMISRAVEKLVYIDSVLHFFLWKYSNDSFLKQQLDISYKVLEGLFSKTTEE
jgi:hypothetical protein